MQDIEPIIRLLFVPFLPHMNLVAIFVWLCLAIIFVSGVVNIFGKAEKNDWKR